MRFEEVDDCRGRDRAQLATSAVRPACRLEMGHEDGKQQAGMACERLRCHEGPVDRREDDVGDDFDLVLEVHRGMDKAQAIAFGREVEKFHPMVLEDPVPPDNYDTMAEVASKVAVPITTGERFISLG